MKKVIILLIILLAGAGFLVWRNEVQAPHDAVTTSTPMKSASATATAQLKNITVTSPKAGDTVGNPITVTGTARVFENTFNYILRDAKGKKLFEGNAMTNAEDSGIFGSYSIKIPVPVGASQDLTVEVFEYSAKDGSVINLVSVPVHLASQATMKVKMFLSNGSLNPQDSCEKVFSISRTVISTQEPAFIALTELLKGPTSIEKGLGYATNIPSDTRLNSIVISNGTARVDFDGTLGQGGGSCHMTALRAQIVQTLKQFPSVTNVIISIDGRTEGILQP